VPPSLRVLLERQQSQEEQPTRAQTWLAVKRREKERKEKKRKAGRRMTRCAKTMSNGGGMTPPTVMPIEGKGERETPKEG
jgi:hypothetical protein